MNAKNILVSGCGGDIGQSIGKILNNHTDLFNIYGIDLNDRTPSKFIYKNFEVGLPANNVSFLKFISTKLKENKIDLYIPIAEAELRFFTNNDYHNYIEDSIILMANKKSRIIGFDKLLTSNFLKENNFPFPETYEANSQYSILKYPFVLKSKTGAGGKSNYLINDDLDLKYYKQKLDLDNYIFQEYLSNQKGEFTCGVFRSKYNEIRTIVFKRELTGGYSGYGELIQDEQIDSFLKKLAESLQLMGSINIQFRFHNGVPVIFEINPRFSSTVFFRKLFGFNDLLWSIQDKLDQPIDDFKLNNLRYFYKGFLEYVD